MAAIAPTLRLPFSNISTSCAEAAETRLAMVRSAAEVVGNAMTVELALEQRVVGVNRAQFVPLNSI